MAKIEWGITPIDFNNTQQLAEDVWLFLTNANMPEKATIKRGALLHEVKVMLESCRQHYAQQQSIAYSEWVDTNAVRNCAHEWTIGSGKNTKRYTSQELHVFFLKQQSKS